MKVNAGFKLTTLRRTAAAAALLLLPAAYSAGAEEERTRHPGFVDGSAFAELAGEEGKLVEVSLHGPLLKQVAKAMARKGKDSGIGSFLEGVVSISAVVVEEPLDPGAARDRMRGMAEKMEKARWEHIARVREAEEDVWVYVLYDERGENLNGLTVLVSGSDELVFVNLAGRIDLGLIGDLAAGADIPGLDDLFDEDVTRSLREYEKSRSRGEEEDKDRESGSDKKSKDGRSEGGK
jgi:hypothetical protein